MSTHEGFYRQIDGLAMGSAPAPFLANGWLSQFDPKIKDDAKLYYRYMDDIVREIKTENIDQKLNEILITPCSKTHYQKRDRQFLALS